jgi:hypothetical protein
MNATEFALKLIQDYNTEHNRYRRAHAAISRLRHDNKWHEEAYALNIKSFYARPSGLSHKDARNTFLDRGTNMPTNTLFVSSGVKSGRIRAYNSKIKLWKSTISPHAADRIKEIERVLEIAKNAPVKAVLGRKWRQHVAAQSAADDAYESRWEARCAITAFNKMKCGITIKFGTCDRGGGSMSVINYIVVDGDKVKLAKFLDNALFETAILNG